jgi:hypothetical protein
LLSSSTLNNPPPSAILSHTWGNSEVIFREAEAGGITGCLEKFHTLGFDKIRHTCEQALKDGLNYVWIDTCCIDKSSSAKLSEAINSMFSWYKRSHVCYAYLSDVPPTKLSLEGLLPDSFNSSRWFTRSWTLQELVAPSNLVFLASDWSVVATRDSNTSPVSTITGIDTFYLIHPNDKVSGKAVHGPNEKSQAQRRGQDIWESIHVVESVEFPQIQLSVRLSSASIEERTSWASRRQATRVEDIAYCLLGIFGVNMPLVYGEGERAFIRLQEEIQKHSSDCSILAWTFIHDGKPLKPFISDVGISSFRC